MEKTIAFAERFAVLADLAAAKDAHAVAELAYAIADEAQRRDAHRSHAVGCAAASAALGDAACASVWARSAAIWTDSLRCAVIAAMCHDYHRLRDAAQGLWSDDTAVAPELFGALWPDDPPEGWPA